MKKKSVIFFPLYFTCLSDNTKCVRFHFQHLINKYFFFQLDNMKHKRKKIEERINVFKSKIYIIV